MADPISLNENLARNEICAKDNHSYTCYIWAKGSLDSNLIKKLLTKY